MDRIRRAPKGERIVITRLLSHAEIVKGFRELRQHVNQGKMTIRQMIEAGRRY